MYISVSDLASVFLVGAAVVTIIRFDCHWFAVLIVLGGLYLIDTFRHVH